MARTSHSQCRGPKVQSHMPQLNVPHATTKAQHGLKYININKQIISFYKQGPTVHSTGNYFQGLIITSNGKNKNIDGI